MSGAGAKELHRLKAESEVKGEDFKVILLQIKQEKGLSWKEMGAITGRAPGTIASYVHRQRTWVSKAVVEDIMGRLSGLSLPPTKRQEAEYTALRRKDQSDQRSQTLAANKVAARKGKIDELRRSLGAI